ncbi:DUF6526 family protein [Paenibacillus ginsengarvi]|uniref:Uncharacterized protein n=1 Tax=Paenibacillus ginsengarvi TaxID=400777 RepID=A0A3B0B7X8_9BACL|nr:DUF6526 family protein [Paenibacillus ginsengarvi]RKN70115.1 hypothetical protein D7M11_30665 [Paenibacillus ginsengarvi]
MDVQNYGNHKRLHPPYHFGLSILTLAVLIGSIVNAVIAFRSGEGRLAACLLVGVGVALVFLLVFVRTYALKAQDRALQTEVQLRHYMLTGKPIDSRLGVLQLVALRFASDEELAELCRRAAEEQLSPDAIKRSIKTWRPDQYRI